MVCTSLVGNIYYYFMKQMNFQGVIKAKTPVTEVWQNAMPKMSFIIEETWSKQYKDSLVIDAIKDKVDLVEKLPIGSEVAIQYNGRANQYNDKMYNGLSLWKLEVISEPEVEEQNDVPF